MIKLIILSVLFYLIFKGIVPAMKLIKFRQAIKNKNKREKFHKKISKMDIQDAEFEEN